MALVDLRGREREPDVLSLLDADPAWVLVGWSRDDELVACAGVERSTPDDVVVRALEARHADDARALLDFIATSATAARIVAEVGATDAAVYAEAGFECEIRAAWGRETSDDPDDWTEENPARGQCAVTAMLVRELLGGEIIVSNVLRDGRRVDRHAWNRLPSGLALDLTREQFRNGEHFGEPRVEEPVFTHRNPERFATLRGRVLGQLGLDG